VRQAIGLFNTRKKLMKSQIDSQKETIVQRQQDIKEITARIKNQRASLTLQEEQIAISEDLLKQDLTNRYNHLDLLKEATRLKGRIEEDNAVLQSAKSGLKEARSKLDSIRGTFDEEVRKQLETKRRTFNELTQRLRKFADSLQRTVVRSPVDGVVKTLYVVTVGGVLKPGSEVADIVPAGDRLIIEAKLPTQDIGFVSAGQAAKIRLASSDATRFGAIEGNVTTVSPDTLITPEGSPYYKVRIETDQDHFKRGNITYHLFPGMQVSASILTGKRAVYEYLLGPFMTSMGDAMQER
jgi:adhesin transport system membrane fusion protein